MGIVIFLGGMLLGGVVAFLIVHSSKKAIETRLFMMDADVQRLRTKGEQLQEEKVRLVSETERLKECLRQTEDKLANQKKEMGEISQLMTEQFRNMAGTILEDKSRRFTETNRENIEKILQPLNKDIEEFKKKVDETYHKEATERTLLERKIAELVQLNNQIRIDAANLTSALKGNSKAQGDWGEMILERILENSGLTKGREYFIQETLKDQDNRVVYNDSGKAMRPDVMVLYPDNRRVIIDSKVSLTAYVNYCNAETDAEREVALKEHLHSVRKHIDELATKGYDNWADNTLDFVMMFVPNEASYVLAMQHDSALWSDAYQKRVLLLSPANLIVSLKLTADLWAREYQNRNAQEIAERGARLYDKCIAFFESFQAIGDCISKTQTVYDQALGRLKTGSGNIVSQAKKLHELGVKSKKAGKDIPRSLTDGME